MKKLFVFGNRRLVAYLTFISAFAPLSTDLYLPALPRMVEALNTDEGAVGLTVSGFFLVYSLSMLLWGPFSDKYGRRPILLFGCVLYVVSSLAIALTDAIGPLLAWRGAQALGGGALSAMSLAVVKDVLRGGSMEKIISWMQTVGILAPMLAPILGGAILFVADWRGIFLMLAAIGVLALIGACGLKETCPPARRNPDPPLRSLGRLFVVLRQRRFAWPLLLFSAMSMPFMAYLGVSAYVFQTRFGLTPQQYSLFFAGNGAACLLGPLLHMYVFRHLRRRRVIACHLAATCLFGVLLCLFGGRGPWAFAVLFGCIAFTTTALRPPAVVLMLEGVTGDTGSVTALINCCGMLCGSVAISLAALPHWTALSPHHGPILASGLICAAVSGLGFLGWRAMLRCGVVQ